MNTKYFPLLFLTIFNLVACGRQGGSSDVAALNSQVNSGKELASLGEAKVHEGYLELLGRVNPNIESQIKTPAGKKRLVDSLIEQELLYQESLKRGLSASPQVREKAALYQRVIFGQALLDEEVEKKAKEFYDANKEKEFSQVEIAHILIRTIPSPPPPTLGKEEKTKAPAQPDTTALDSKALKKAQEAKAKLDSGTPWQEVVNTYSDDAATKSRDGELGLVSREDRRVTRLDWNELVNQAFAMKVGEISGPIKAKDGYHIIKILKEAVVAPYEEVENGIKFRLRAQTKNELLTNLMKGEKIDYKDESLKSSGTPPMPGIPGQMVNPGDTDAQVMQVPGSSQVINIKPAPGVPSSAATASLSSPVTKPEDKLPKQKGDGSQVIQTPSGPQVVKTKE